MDSAIYSESIRTSLFFSLFFFQNCTRFDIDMFCLFSINKVGCWTAVISISHWISV